MDAEKNFIDAWNAGKVHRVSDGAKPWVGLTDEDKQKLAAEQHSWESLCSAVEAKLKEKNT
jgi:hypothetical protein